MAIITLTNLITNGSFEFNTTGWSAPTTITRPNVSPQHGEFGSSMAQVSYRTQRPVYFETLGINIIREHRYYIRALVQSTAGETGCTLQNSSTSLGFSVSNISNRWVLLDGIWTADAVSLVTRFAYTGASGNTQRTIQLDNVVILDLTDSYGINNEPSISDIRQILTDNNGYFSTINIEVLEPLIITTETISNAIIGINYLAQINTNYETAVFSATGLPPGLTIVQETGLINGIPTKSGNYNITVTATSGGQITTKTYTIYIAGESKILKGLVHIDDIKMGDRNINIVMAGNVVVWRRIIKNIGDVKYNNNNILYNNNQIIFEGS